MRPSIELAGAACALAGALAAWSCGSGGYGGDDPNPAGPSDSGPNVTVNIGAGFNANSFNPNPVPANVGQTVAFRNNDSVAHHIVLDNGSADFGVLAPGTTSRTVTVGAGSGNFHCTNHPTMVGSINGPVPDAPPCDPSYGYC
jgi:plastocyanin